MDIKVQDHGSIVILLPVTPAGQDWLDEHIDDSAMRCAGGIVCEPRYVGPIIGGAIGDGLDVG